MRRFSWAFLVAAFSVAPAGAGTILYATGATPGHINGFCVARNGSLTSTPKVQVDALGKYPRRLQLTPDNRVLFAAENDRVEVFSVGDAGGLRLLGHIPVPPERGSNPRDMSLAADGRTLYFPQRQQNRIRAFQLDYPTGADGRATFAVVGESCVPAPDNTGLERVLATPTILYVTTVRAGATYRLAPDGRFIKCVVGNPDDNTVPPVCDDTVVLGEDGCEVTDDAEAPIPSSQRRRQHGAGAFVVANNRIYIEQRFSHHVLGYQLNANGEFDFVLNDKNKPYRQKKFTKTHADIRYVNLTMSGESLLGTQFLDGRVDAYRVDADGKLSRQPRIQTRSNVFSSPVRMLVRNDVLYVSGGQLDRVQGYHLGPNGFPNDQPFTETDEDRGSFPNDIAIAEIPGNCD